MRIMNKKLLTLIMLVAVIGIIAQPISAIQVTDPDIIGTYHTTHPMTYCGVEYHHDIGIEAYDNNTVRMTMSNIPDEIPTCKIAPLAPWISTEVTLLRESQRCVWEWTAHNDWRFGNTPDTTKVIICHLKLGTGNPVILADRINWQQPGFVAKEHTAQAVITMR